MEKSEVVECLNSRRLGNKCKEVDNEGGCKEEVKV